MEYNVLGNCAGTKTHKGTCADWVFVEAEQPKGSAAVTVCYAKLCFTITFTYIYFYTINI